MATSTEIKQRANTLADKTDVNSITPKEVGGIMYDLASHGENVLRNGGTLGIRKVYESVAAMEADSTNPKDFWGDPIKKGNLVVIYDGTTTGVDNNKIYAFMKPGWQIATHLDAGYATKAGLDAAIENVLDSLRNSEKALNKSIDSLEETVTENKKEVDEKISELGSKLDELNGNLDKPESEEIEIEKVLEQGFFITDKEGNVALKYDERGLCVAKARPMPSTMIDVDMRLLIIGNSYSVDAVAYLPELLKGNGISYTIGIVYYSGQGIDAHIRAFDNEYAHEYYEYSSDIGYWQRLENSSTKSVLDRIEWNAVFFHEVSGNSTNLTAIKKSLKQLLNKVDEYISYKTNYGYILTPAYGTQSSGYSESMWEGINEVGKYLMNVKEIDFIVPIHTAIENARTNIVLQSFGADLMASASDRHIEDGIGRYIEACTMYTYLKDFFGFYKDVRESDFVPKYGENVIDGYNSLSRYPQTSEFAEINENAKRLSIKSALMAIAKPYTINNI